MKSLLATQSRRSLAACVVMAIAAAAIYAAHFSALSAWPVFLILGACVIAGVIAASYQAVPLIIVTFYIVELLLHGSPLPNRTEGLAKVVVLFIVTTAFWSLAVAFGVWLATRQERGRRRGRR